MEEVILDLVPREVSGKAVKHLRREGTVPAVIHDHGKASVMVMGPYLAMAKAYHQAGKHHPLQLKVSGKRYTALIKDVDIDPKKHQVRHVVFNAVKANEKVTAQIPVRIHFDEGNEVTPAERSGLIVLHQLDTVEVEAIPTKLPDVLEFDGEKLINVGDHATGADLLIPEGVELKTDPTQSLATVFEPGALQAANESAGGTGEEEAPQEAAEPAEGGAEAGEAAPKENQPEAKGE